MNAQAPLRVACCVVALLSLGTPAGHAQVPGATAGAANADAASAATPLPVYDVVTIRPNKDGPGHRDIDEDTNTFAASNVSLLDLIHIAYDIQPELVSSGAPWAGSSRWDVRAKITEADRATLEALPDDARRRMLQVLLADRFHLQVHTEVKTLPVLELVQAKGGAMIKAIAPDHKDDSFHGQGPGSTAVHNGNMLVTYRTMVNVADTLSAQVHRTVIDKTGLAGYYSFELDWTRDDVPVPENATAPPLQTALEEQLGLKLVAGKGPVTTLVIDHAELPVPDEN